MPQGDPRLRGDDKMVAGMTWGRSEGEASPFGTKKFLRLLKCLARSESAC